MSTANLLAILAVVGSLAGVALGAWLTSRRQHKQWILDNKKLEYRELLDALQSYRWVVTQHRRVDGSGAIRLDVTAESHYALADALNSVWNKVSDRLFVREALVNSGVHQDLQNLHKRLVVDAPLAWDQWIKSWYELYRKLLRMACKEVGLPAPKAGGTSPDEEVFNA
jgi:hypothetical protein